jgi:hypothetical protein
MKKGLLITLGILVALIGLLALSPFLFKDKIRQAIDDQIAKNINAKVGYDANQFGLSIFSNFPNITVSLGGISLVGVVEEFKGDTLFAADKFRLELDIMSVISGDKIKIKGVYLDKAKIVTIMAANGKSSWDITFPSTDTTTTAPEEPSTLSIGIEQWKISDATIIYDDRTLPMYAKFMQFNHEGSGDITADIYDLTTYTHIEDTYVNFDGVTYLNHNVFDAKAKVNIDMAKSKYTFLDNQFAINDFKFGFNGFLAMPAEGMDMDITYEAKETEFKNILSLVPGVYTKDFNDIKTSGSLAFNGYVKGMMTDTQLPGFGLNLLVKDGMLQYPDLPTAVKNIGIDLNVDAKDGNLDQLLVNLKKFHMDMGNMPIDARLISKGMDPYDLDANVLAKINLEEVTKIFPVDGTQLKGALGVDVKAKGKYSDSLHLMPVVDALFTIDNGYVKSKDFPLPLEQVFLKTIIKSTGDMATTVVNLERFQMLLDKEKFEATALVKNLDAIEYQATLKGIIDLAKMTKVYPIEGTTLTGRINTDIQTKGTMADIDAGKYQNTSTSGTMSIDKLTYAAKDLPQGFTITRAAFNFDPAKMNIENMVGTAGKSDYAVNGYFANYMGYIFGGKDSTLKGVLNYSGNKLDVNEWMAEEEATSPAPADTAASAMSVVEVPKNLDFVFNSNVKEVLYDNLNLQNFAGSVIVKEGILALKGLNFLTLGGKFHTDMLYNTQNIKDPKFAMDLKIQQLGFKEAFAAFNTVQKLAPVAKNMEGKMDLNIVMAGSLDQTMSVVYNTLNGSGNLLIPNAQLANSKVLDGLASVTKMQGLSPLALNNVKVNFTIVDGNLMIAPFDVKAGEIKMNVGGKSKIDGDMDMIVKMDVPTGAMGEAAAGALSSLAGTNISAPKSIKMDLNMTGTYDNPKVRVVGTSAGEGEKPVKEKVKEAAKTEIKNQIQNNEQVKQAQAEIDRQKKEAEAKIKQEQARLQKEAEEKAKQEAEKKAKDLLKNSPFKF